MGIKDALGVITAVFAMGAFFGSILGIIAKLHVKRLGELITVEREDREKDIQAMRDEMREERETREKEINKMCEKFVGAVHELRDDFRNGLKKEGEFRQEIMTRYGTMIEKQDEMITELFSKKVDKETCRATHKWDGDSKRA